MDFGKLARHPFWTHALIGVLVAQAVPGLTGDKKTKAPSSSAKAPSAKAAKEARDQVFKIIQNQAAADLLNLKLQTLDVAPVLLNEEGRWDDEHKRAIEIAETALQYLVRHLKTNRESLLHYIGYSKGKLVTSRMRVNLTLVQMGLRGATAADGATAMESAMALSNYIAKEAIQPRAAGVTLTATAEKIIKINRELDQQQARQIAWAPLDPAIDLTLGLFCLVGTVTSIVAAPETGGTSLLVTAGLAAGTASRLKKAVSVSKKISRGQDLDPWDATLLLELLPAGKGAESFDRLRAGIGLGESVSLAQGYDARKLVSNDPNERLAAFDRLVTILDGVAGSNDLRSTGKSGGADTDAPANKKADKKSDKKKAKKADSQA